MYVCMYVCMYVTAYNSGAFWSQFKNKTRRFYSLREIKFCLEFLINNEFIQVGPKTFRYSYGVRSCDILFLFFYESRRLKSIKNTKYGVARKFGNIIRFIDDLNCNK